mmetsp:Transcript_13929/g.40082  ORF Transcript_13929/g.40082 Transcript_13929/m.40082 type:complete len:214 (+) Transcript_13929:917-1558(+)
MIWLDGVSVNVKKLGTVPVGMSNSSDIRQATVRLFSTGHDATHRFFFGPKMRASRPYTVFLHIQGMFCSPNSASTLVRSPMAARAAQSKPPCAYSAPRRVLLVRLMWGAILCRMGGWVCAGAATMTRSESGMTALGSSVTVCSVPLMVPLLSQLDPLVTILIERLHSSGRRVNTFTFNAGLEARYPAATCAPLPPPHTVTVSEAGSTSILSIS